MRHNDGTCMDEPPLGEPVIDRDASRARDSRLVEAALAGDPSAFGRLYDAWFDRVWNVALRIVHDREVAAEVAQDTFVSAWRNLRTLDDVDAFGGWLLRIARNASFNRSRKEARSSPVDDRGITVIEAVGSSPPSAPAGFGVEDRARRIDDPGAMAEDRELVALVRTSATALGERDAEVLDLQLRYGLSPAEIGEVMGLNRNAANQLCHRVRQRFATAVRARVLWRGERPACDALAQMLASAGVTTFDGEAVRIADKHADGCPQCGERRELRLQPSAMFAAVPLVAAPIVLKTQTADALEAVGVDMDGSSFGTAGEHRGDGSRRGPRRGRRLTTMAIVAVVILIAVTVALASHVHDPTVDTVAADVSTTMPTTASTPPTIAVESPTTEAVTDVSVDEPPSTQTTVPADGSISTTVPPPAPVLDLVLNPTSRPQTYTAFPVLRWSVTGAAGAGSRGPRVAATSCCRARWRGVCRCAPARWSPVPVWCRRPAATTTSSPPWTRWVPSSVRERSRWSSAPDGPRSQTSRLDCLFASR